jgi:hypothetical protein
MYLLTDDEFKAIEGLTTEAFIAPIRNRKLPINLTKSQQSAIDKVGDIIKSIGK